MVNSMTGYGRASESLNMREITVEIRSVNHRYFDCTVKTARAYSFLEDMVKTELQTCISRGKVDVFITIDTSDSDDVCVSINEPLLRGYLDIINKLESEYGIVKGISVSEVMRLPDLLSVKKQEADAEELCEDVRKVLRDALAGYCDMRAKEGERLAGDMVLRLGILSDFADKVEVRSPKCVEEYRQKLEARMQEVLESAMIEPQRILTEAAIFADKIAVTEEIVRLRSHISQFNGMLKKGGPVGRKLDFLVQELNREVNTMGSKANDLEVSEFVVDMKAEIEKIREQVQNLE